MGDILLSWLRQDVGLEVTNIERVRWELCSLKPAACKPAQFVSACCLFMPSSQQFSNGWLWGQLFATKGMCPDLDRFSDQHDPDSMVNNYTRLQVRA